MTFIFLKLLLITTFENTKNNIILMLSKNCSYFFNLLIYIFSVFLIIK